MGLFTVEHPKLAKEFISFVKPETVLEQVTSGSGMVASWLCPEGHIYETSVRHRVYGHGCPYCAGSKLLKGFNDIATTHPKLVKYWSSKNIIKPDELTAGSTVKVFWDCGFGHETFLRPADRLKTATCRQCSKNNVMFLNQHPLYEELDLKKNSNVDYSLTPVKSSEQKLFWKCDLGHSFEATVKNRYNGRGCPFCAGRKLLTGFNDFATVHPELVKYWNDISVAPDAVYAGSGRVVSWKCDLGHSYSRSVSDRVKQKVSCPVCLGSKVLIGFNNIATTNPDVAVELSDVNDGNVLSRGSRQVVSWRCNAGHVYDKRVNERTRKESRGCPVCNASNGESELSRWLDGLGLTMVKNTRKVIPPFELDVFFPDLNIAVEYNGLYWHSEANLKDSKYHVNKTEACAAKNIQLVHVWEDDWIYRKDIVKKMLANKLGVSAEDKINARSCSIVVVSSSNAEEFLNANHIQGFVASSYYMGLMFNEKLVAVMALRQEKNRVYITRYATSGNVRGGFSKLLKHTVKGLPDGVSEIVTFADSAVSEGKLYESNGFVKDRVLKPDYKYVVGSRRVHKFNFRKDKFEKNDGLLFDPSLTEKQLAALNNIPRIWDSGKIRYVLHVA